ncbi:serine/threonine-protein kinase [uncultured Arsenicicoccus sp.]|uniref:serine/threonine-protein kinase n=1 Tax=uncultured Arsenicicoccus sp. TaxID=491339 RepID=UPI00259ABD6A|nr:serine/threonine-protein kinase [uncultured Arsenicicoccus sp.]
MARPAVPGYDVQAVLGGGAASVVWRAERLSDRRAVALKVSREPLRLDDPWQAKGWSTAPRDAESVLRELDWLRQVHHPGVVELLDALVLDDQRVVVVLTLAEGGSLSDLVRSRGHLTPSEVVSVLLGLATTIRDLHGARLVHGDLSPGNVLLDAAGRPLVGDLGTLSAFDEAVEDPWGTTGFVAPDVVAGGEPTAASDVYSLGALAWYALVGEARPAATDPRELDARVPDTPAELLDVVRACLAPRPDDRPEVGDLVDSLAALGSAPVEVSPADRPEDVTRRVREQAAEQERALTRARVRAQHLEEARRRAARPRLLLSRRALALSIVVGLALGVLGGRWWLDRRDAQAAAAAARPAAVTSRQGAVASAPAATSAGTRSGSAPAPSAPTSTGQGQPQGHGQGQGQGQGQGPRPGQGQGQDPVRPSSRSDGVQTDARAVLQDLFDARAAALMAKDAAALGTADADGSWARTHDDETIGELRRRGQSQRGLRFVVQQAQAVSSAAGSATVRASVRLGDYTWTEAGAPPRTAAGHGGRSADYHLRWTAHGWRLDRVDEPGAGGQSVASASPRTGP